MTVRIGESKVDGDSALGVALSCNKDQLRLQDASCLYSRAPHEGPNKLVDSVIYPLRWCKDTG